MPDLLHDFATDPDRDVKLAVGCVFAGLESGGFRPHWVRWVQEETWEAIFNVGRELHGDGANVAADS